LIETIQRFPKITKVRPIDSPVKMHMIVFTMHDTIGSDSGHAI